MVAPSRLALFAAFALACGTERDVPAPAQTTQLPEGVAAQVGSDDIPTQLVRDVARAQGVSLAQARERAYRAVGAISWPGMQFRTDIASAAAKLP